MIIYISATLLSVFFAWLSQIVVTQNCLSSCEISVRRKINSVCHMESVSLEKIFYFLSFLPFYIISAIRWNTGSDTWFTYAPDYIGMKLGINGVIPQAEETF